MTMLELLIVDDDAMMRESLAMLLRREGFAVTLAAGGDAAIQSASQQAFDIVICDIRMPGTDGIGVVRQIRELQPGTHFVLITGYASEEATVQALRLKVDDYFRKPFDLPAFLERIRGIGRRRLRQGSAPEQAVRRFALLLAERWPAWGEAARRAEAACRQEADARGLDDVQRQALTLAALFHGLRRGIPLADPSPEETSVLEEAARLLSSPVSEILEAALRGDVAAAPAPVAEAPAATPLAITTLGRIEVHVNGRLVDRAAWESSSARNLFLFLVAERGRRVAEERLIERFWPGSDLEKGRRALKTAVYRIRKALENPEVVVTGERYYQFNSQAAHTWDVKLMEQSVAAAQKLEQAGDRDRARREWQAAGACYGGEFLEGLSDEWIEPWRAQLHQHAVQAASREAALHLELGNSTASETAARRALALEPTREDAHATLVRALSAQGRRDDAVRAWHHAADVLQRVLGLRPGPDLLRAQLELKQN